MISDKVQTGTDANGKLWLSEHLLPDPRPEMQLLLTANNIS